MNKIMRKILIFGFGALMLYLIILMSSLNNIFQMSDNEFNIENEKMFVANVQTAPCSKGYWRGQYGCERCASGYWCDGTKRNKCAAGLTSDPGSDEESDCKKPASPATCSISLVSSPSRVSVGDTYTISFKTTGAGCNGMKVSYSTSNATRTGTTSSTVSNGGTFYVSTKALEACNDSNKSKITVRLENGKSVTSSVRVIKQWGIIETGLWPTSEISGAPTSLGDADSRGLDYYYSGKRKCLNGEFNGYCYTQLYSRSCGTIPTPKPTKYSACYMNINTGKYSWGEYSGNSNYSLISYITSSSECITPPENVDVSCNSNIKPSSKSSSVNSCNGSTTVDLNTGKSCSSTVSGSYYNITCSPETVNIKFNPDDFSNSLFAGQGFSYNISVTSKRTCSGSFDSKKWNEAYDKVIYGVDYYKKRMNDTKYSDSKRREYASSYNEYLNKLKDLVNMVIDYNEYQEDILSDYSMTPVATMEIYKTKKVNGVVIEEKRIAQPTFEEFKVTEVGSGTLSERETYKLSATKQEIENYGINATGFANPIKFSYTNKYNPKSGEFNLVKTYINRTTGEISNNSHEGDANWIDAGNKYYTSMDLDSDYSYVIKINVNNLGTTKNLTVTNNQCEFKIKDNNQKLIYRHIDTFDPFINNTNRDIGTNWLNNKYDFRKIIKSSNAVLYKFNITGSDIVEIRKSNSLISGSEEYLGVCQNSLYSNDIVCKKLKGND